MSMLVPNILEVEILTSVLTPALTLKLYSNDKTPVAGDTSSAYTEVTGGGYSSKSLTFANWTITSGDPSVATYNSVQTWTFTGPTDSPATIYGYYVIRVSDGHLMWAERFPSANVPFSTIAGSVIKVLPKFTAQSAK